MFSLFLRYSSCIVESYVIVLWLWFLLAILFHDWASSELVDLGTRDISDVSLFVYVVRCWSCVSYYFVDSGLFRLTIAFLSRTWYLLWLSAFLFFGSILVVLCESIQLGNKKVCPRQLPGVAETSSVFWCVVPNSALLCLLFGEARFAVWDHYRHALERQKTSGFSQE